MFASVADARPFWTFPYMPAEEARALFRWTRQHLSHLFHTGQLHPYTSGLVAWCSLPELARIIRRTSADDADRLMDLITVDCGSLVDDDGYMYYRVAARLLNISPYRMWIAARSSAIEAKDKNSKPRPIRSIWWVDPFSAADYFREGRITFLTTLPRNGDAIGGQPLIRVSRHRTKKSSQTSKRR